MQKPTVLGILTAKKRLHLEIEWQTYHTWVGASDEEAQTRLEAQALHRKRHSPAWQKTVQKMMDAKDLSGGESNP